MGQGGMVGEKNSVLNISSPDAEEVGYEPSENQVFQESAYVQFHLRIIMSLFYLPAITLFTAKAEAFQCFCNSPNNKTLTTGYLTCRQMLMHRNANTSHLIASKIVFAVIIF